MSYGVGVESGSQMGAQAGFGRTRTRERNSRPQFAPLFDQTDSEPSTAKHTTTGDFYIPSLAGISAHGLVFTNHGTFSSFVTSL